LIIAKLRKRIHKQCVLNTLMQAVAVFVGTLLAVWLWYYWITNDPHYEDVRDELLMARVRPGESLWLRRTVNRDKLCMVDVDVFIIHYTTQGEELMMQSRRLLGGWNKLGKSTNLVKMDVDPLPPNEYVMRGFVHTCGVTTQLNDIKFEVVADGD
jgi:hypothetical protein